MSTGGEVKARSKDWGVPLSCIEYSMVDRARASSRIPALDGSTVYALESSWWSWFLPVVLVS